MKNVPTVIFDTQRFEDIYGYKPGRFANWWTFSIAGNVHETPRHMTYAQAKRWFIQNEADMYGNAGDSITVEVMA